MDAYPDSFAHLGHISSSAAPLFSVFKSTGTCRLAIVIPVRNEAENILDTLQAFARQTRPNKKPIDFESFEILVLANNCTDNSVGLIRKFQRENSFLHIHLAEIFLGEENANIGFVRRLLMNEAFYRLRNSAFGDGVIMTTDSDTVVADDWVGSNLLAINAGADAVGGRILIADAQLEKMNKLCREIHLKDDKYQLLIAELEGAIDDLPFDAMPRHYQQADMYGGARRFGCEGYEKRADEDVLEIIARLALVDPNVQAVLPVSQGIELLDEFRR